jgi:hypothetical protein
LKFRLCFELSAFAALLLSSAQAHAQQPVQTLHGHVRPAVASGQAKRVGDLPAAQRLNVSIVLAPRNQAELTGLLGELYDSNSPAYHKFLSVSQFAEQFSPSAEDYEAVVDFAGAHRLVVAGTPANRLVVPVTGTVEQIESAFNVRLGVYQHPTEPRTFYSPDREPSLDLAVPVAHIVGLNDFSIPKPMVTRSTAVEGAATAATGAGPGGSYLGSDMRAAYYGGTTLTGAGQSVGLAEFDGYDLSDVSLTFSNSGQSYSVPINNVLLDGATGAACQFIPANCSDAEQVLDVAQAIWMAPDLSQVRVYIGDSDPDILNAIAADDIAQQVSISWTWLPDDPSTDDIFFQEMAAQGQSVFAASGDYGEFDPLINNFYPAEDAWVTSVGGTDLVTTGAGGAWSSETAWSNSGGGISPDGTPLPIWQAGVADASNGGSNTLRNVPDVAMEANTDNYDCNLGACTGTWGGTSFAAPRWAAFMALVNEQAATTGDPQVGFANPALYAIGQSSSYSSDFHDITVGNNDNEGNCCGQAYYNAVPGYDLVTGWGSPTGQDLINNLAPAVAPGFQLSPSTKSLIINPGSSGKTTITVKDLGGFTGSIELSVSGLPSGVTASWGSNPTSSSSALTLTVGTSAVRGSYLVTVTGTSGSVTATTSVALEVNAPGFTVEASPATLRLEPGQSTSTTVILTDEAGFNGSVNLAVTSALPSGVTATWNPDPTTGTSVLTLTASSSATPDLRGMVTIEGSSGSATASATVALNMNGPIFLLGISPEPANIVRGSSTTSTVTVLPAGGFTGSVTLSATQLPAGVTATFNPVTTTGTSTLTMTASSSAALGTSSVQIMGTNASCCASYTNFSQTVTASPTFNLSASSLSLNVTQGGTASDTITVNPLNGFTGSVNLAAANLPSGISASWGTNPTSGTSVLTISAVANAVVGGQYLVVVTGSSGNQTSQNVLDVTVNPPPGFTLSPSSASVSVTAGSSVTDKITVTPQTGFSGSVNLAVTSALPSGASASFGTNPTTGSSVLTLVTSSSTVPGSYPVIIAGTSNGRTVTTNFVLSVEDPVGTSTVLSISPTGNLAAGAAYTLTATVTPATGTVTPTGNVTFNIGSGTQTVALNSAGVATYAGTAPASAGPLTISATYQGSTSFVGSTSNTLNETVVAIGTTSALGISPSGGSLTAGAAYTLTATVTPASGTVTPTGNVTFNIGSGTQTVALNSAGVATYAGTAPASAGPLTISATYQGSAEFSSSTSSTLNETVVAIGTTSALGISPSGGSLTSGAAYTLTATVTPASGTVTPTGNVTFNIGSGTQTVALNSAGVATYAGTAPASAGPLTISATYQGSAEFSSSTSSTLNETVVAIGTTSALGISPSGGSLTSGAAYTLTATVTPASGTVTPTGNVTFNIGTGTQTVALNSAGVATYAGTAPASAGPLTISATYQGSAEFSSSTSNSLNETVVAVGTTSALGISPSGGSLTAGAAYTLTATVTPASGTVTPTGNVTFNIGSGTQTVALNSAGVATYAGTAPASAGPLTISATYKGSAEFSSSTSSTLNETVVATGTTSALGISPSGGSLTAGAAYTLTATVTAASGTVTPTGNVTFNIGTGTQTVALNSAGVAIYAGTAPASAGPLTISATYKGSAEFSPSTSNSLNETVVAIGTMSALGISPSGGSLAAGEPYTLTASVSPTSGTATCTGNVLFTIGSTTQTVALNASGVATYTITAPAAGGSLTISAAYQGSAEFSPSTSNTMNETVLTISPILPYIEVNGGAWQYVASVTVAYGSTVNLGPQPGSGGTWSWTGPNGFTSTSRQINSIPLTSASNTFTATYTNSVGLPSTQVFTITIAPTPIVPYIQDFQLNGGAVNFGPQPGSGGTWSWTGGRTSPVSRRTTATR